MKWKVTDRAQSITSAASQKTNAHKTSDVILCIMLPSATFSERLTSGIVIKNYTGDFLNAVYKHGPAFETAVNNVRTLYNARVIREGRPDLVRPILNFAEVRRLREEAASLLQAAAEKMQIAATIGNASAQGRALFAEGQAMEKKAAVASARADALWRQLPRSNLISGRFSTPNPGIIPHHSVNYAPIVQSQASQSAPP